MPDRWPTILVPSFKVISSPRAGRLAATLAARPSSTTVITRRMNPSVDGNAPHALTLVPGALGRSSSWDSICGARLPASIGRPYFPVQLLNSGIATATCPEGQSRRASFLTGGPQGAKKPQSSRALCGTAKKPGPPESYLLGGWRSYL